MEADKVSATQREGAMIGSPIVSGYNMKLHCEVKNGINEIQFV